MLQTPYPFIKAINNHASTCPKVTEQTFDFRELMKQNIQVNLTNFESDDRNDQPDDKNDVKS